MKLLFAVTAAVLAASSANAVNLLTNGGFEDPVIGNACCNTVGAPGGFPGWTVTTGDINVVNGTFASNPSGTNLAFQGNQYLDLIGESNSGGIQQTFNTVAGEVYTLSFAFSHNLFGNLPAASAVFSVGNIGGTILHNSGSTSDLDWRTVSTTFVAGPGTTSTLTFTSVLNNTSGGVLLDAVNVSAVPESATWGMMIVGFGAMGAVARRRRAIAAHA